MSRAETIEAHLGEARPGRLARLRRGATTRVRILGLFVAIMAVALVLGLLAQRALLLRVINENVDAELRQEVEELEVLSTGSDPETGEPFGSDVRAIFDTFLRRNVPSQAEGVYTLVDGEPYASSPAPLQLLADEELVSRWASVTSPQEAEADTEAGLVRYLAVPVEVEGEVLGTFVAAVFLDERQSVVGDVIGTGALTYGTAFVVAAAVTWFAAGRVLQPLNDLTEAARAISDSNWRERLQVEGDDQIAVLARTFNQMLDRLEAAFSAQRRLIDDAGHELRTPITVIRGHVELMSDDPEERAETRRLVMDELDRMSRMVEDLLLLARAEQPDFLHLHPVDVDDLLDDIVAKAEMLDGDTSVGREWSVVERPHAVVIADEQRLTQAMMNLCRNAAEHTPPGTRVTLGGAMSRDAVLLWVEDDGPGIPLEEQDRIFERFRRGGGGQRRSEGAGLGLAITRVIAEAHGGTLSLCSAPGEGARFTLSIPTDAADDDAFDRTGMDDGGWDGGSGAEEV